MAHILVVEDEQNLANLLRRHLEEEGYQVTLAFDGRSGLDAARRARPDLVVLDVMLPELDGLSVCRAIRQMSGEARLIPILMLTARAEEIDRVVGLEVGADDYVSKPFSIRELLARVRAHLRRIDMMRAATADAGGPIQLADLWLDAETHEVRVREQPVELTVKEFELLHFLVAQPGRVFSRAYLLERIWGYDTGGGDRTVDTHIYRLRAKLGESEAAARLATVRGLGYKFQAET